MTVESLFVQLFESKGFSTDEAIDLSARLVQLCPWLEVDDEIAEDLGCELLRDALDPSLLDIVDCDELIRWHNSDIRRRQTGMSKSHRLNAYSELCSLVSNFGVEDAFGDGDYWVVADSLSTADVSIVKYEGSDVEPDLQVALKEWLSARPGFSSVSVINEDGDVLFCVQA